MWLFSEESCFWLTSNRICRWWRLSHLNGWSFSLRQLRNVELNYCPAKARPIYKLPNTNLEIRTVSRALTNGVSRASEQWAPWFEGPLHEGAVRRYRVSDEDHYPEKVLGDFTTHRPFSTSSLVLLHSKFGLPWRSAGCACVLHKRELQQGGPQVTVSNLQTFTISMYYNLL